jgi:hypothetical protein
MTVQQSNFLKNNWINFSTLIVVLGFVVTQSKWQQKVDSHIDNYELHKVDEILHVPLRENISVFVPRTELSKEINNLKASVKSMDSKLDILLKKQR